MRLFLSLVVIGGVVLYASDATAQEPAASLGPTVNPAVAGDPVTHRHKAYSKIAYGISCPGDRVVWVDRNGGVYYLGGERRFGLTKNSVYECEKTARGEGDRETLNGQ